MALLSGIYRYAPPTGMEDMISITSQGVLPDSLDFSRKDETVFWHDFSGNYNTYAIARNKLGKTLLVNLVTERLTTILMNDTSSLTGNGTWSASSFTNAANVAVDTLHFPNGKSGIKFDIDLSLGAFGASSVRNTTMSSVDLSGAAINQTGVVTCDFYWPISSSFPFEIQLIFGSSTVNRYSMTITTQIDGTDFVQGLNQLGFDWAEATTLNTPDDSAITYVNFNVVHPLLLIDVTGVAVSNFVMREKRFVDVHYLSDYLVLDNDGSTLKSSFDDQNDTNSTLLVDEIFWDWLIYHTAEQLFSFYELDQSKLARVSGLRQELEDGLSLKYPSRRDSTDQAWMDSQDLSPYMN